MITSKVFSSKNVLILGMGVTGKGIAASLYKSGANIFFWDDNDLIGCGALKFLDKNHGEFKSIRVSDKFRRSGIGEKIIEHLIEEAKKLEISKLSIETGAGDFFIPARKLFSKFGFKKCMPFAHYKEDPNSCYYTLDL